MTATFPPGLKAGFAVSELSARTGLRLSGRADLSTVDLLKHAIAALPAIPARSTSSSPAWNSSTKPRLASWSC